MNFFDILIQPETTAPLKLTLKVLAVSGALHLVCGILLGYYLTGRKSVMRSAVDFIVTLPLVFPPIATGFILLMLLGRAGLIGQVLPVDIVFSFPGVVLAAFVAGLPLMVKPVEAALRGDVRKLAEASKILGKNDWQTFWLVLLPNVRRNVRPAGSSPLAVHSARSASPSCWAATSSARPTHCPLRYTTPCSAANSSGH